MRLTDTQIEKAHKILRGKIKAMLDGKTAINYKDFKRSGQAKSFSYFGSVTVRQTLRFVDDLIYYKSKVAELQKVLEWYADEQNYTRSEDDVMTGYPHEIMWDKGNKARQALEGDEPNEPLTIHSKGNIE